MTYPATLETYSDLEAAVGDYMARTDLSSVMPVFVSLFEAEANRALRTRQMEVTISTTPSTGTSPLPSDYLTWRRATWTGTPNRVLEYVQPDVLRIYHPIINNASLILNAGLPSMFTIEGSNIIFRPIDTTAVEFDYYQKIPPLSSVGSSTGNWLMVQYPDLYLSGTITEAKGYIQDWDEAGIWKSRRDDQLERIKVLDQKTRAPSYIKPDMRGRIP